MGLGLGFVLTLSPTPSCSVRAKALRPETGAPMGKRKSRAPRWPPSLTKVCVCSLRRRYLVRACRVRASVRARARVRVRASLHLRCECGHAGHGREARWLA